MPYERFVAGATPQIGLFTVWRKQGQVYFELAPAQFDRPFLLVPILASGLGEGLFSGIDFDTILLQFHRNGNTVYTTEQNPHAQAREGSPQAQAVSLSYPQSIINADPETAVNKETGNVVFPASAFLTDIVDLTDIINGPPGSGLATAHYHLDPRLSYVSNTKAFPSNVDLEADLTMSSPTVGPTDTVPDSRSLFLRMHYSIVELPHDGYRPRLADDRIGYFITARRQYDNDLTPSSFERYINRWNIQKSDPSARVSRAKSPIVYYLSNDIPQRYRAPIRAALLTWNRAFEAVGITHAIEVRQQPNDPSWDPDDVRYSVVRWVVSPSTAFAYGPSLTDPRTGEIFRADIVIDANLVRVAANEQSELVDPTRSSLPDPLVPMSAAQRRACALLDCAYGYEAAQQAAWAALALSLDGAFGPSGMTPQTYADDFLRSIVLHESGHDLGLRHNFAGSTAYSPQQLRDKRFTAAHGLSASVMDYVPVNLSPHGRAQGQYFQTVLGPWDYFMIRYGYEPLPARSTQSEKPALEALAAQSSRRELTYGTDEDAEWFDGFAVDPRVETFDLSSDPLAYAEDQFSIDRRLLGTLPARLPLRGHSYADVRRAFVLALQNRFSNAYLATHYVGGEYFSRAHRGDPGAALPFAPVSRATQRRAFELVARNVFDDAALRFRPDLLNRLGDTRFNHWESDPNAGLRQDFPVEEYVEANADFLLRQMWQPVVLERLDSLESRAPLRGETMTLADLFDWTDDAVWGDLSRTGTASIPEVHRALQQHYAALLAHLMLHPDPGTPPDAGALARHHLRVLEGTLGQALARGGYDEATAANLEDIRATVERALSATTTVPAF